MSVYVDDYNAPFGRMTMCHMVADSHEELLTMADRIGVQRKWLQDAGIYSEHFDVCMAKKERALASGAVAITWRELGKIIQAKREKEKDARITNT